MGGRVGFAYARPPPVPKAPERAAVGKIAGYIGPWPMDFGIGNTRNSAEERANRFADGRC